MLILIVSLSISSTDLSLQASESSLILPVLSIPHQLPKFPWLYHWITSALLFLFYDHTSPDVCIFVVVGLETSPTHCDLSSFYLSSLTSSPKEMLKLIFQKHCFITVLPYPKYSIVSYHLRNESNTPPKDSEVFVQSPQLPAGISLLQPLIFILLHFSTWSK